MDFKYFKESALEDASENGMTKEEYREVLLHLENNPLPTREDFEVRRKARKVYTSDGFAHHVVPVLELSGTPILDTMEGHSTDATWEYPIKSTRLSGLPKNAKVVSQAEFVALRAANKKRLKSVKLPTKEQAKKEETAAKQ